MTFESIRFCSDSAIVEAGYVGILNYVDHSLLIFLTGYCYQTIHRLEASLDMGPVTYPILNSLRFKHTQGLPSTISFALTVGASMISSIGQEDSISGMNLSGISTKISTASFLRLLE